MLFHHPEKFDEHRGLLKGYVTLLVGIPRNKSPLYHVSWSLV